jgi:hypothetical protein
MVGTHAAVAVAQPAVALITTHFSPRGPRWLNASVRQGRPYYDALVGQRDAKGRVHRRWATFRWRSQCGGRWQYGGAPEHKGEGEKLLENADGGEEWWQCY